MNNCVQHVSSTHTYGVHGWQMYYMCVAKIVVNGDGEICSGLTFLSLFNLFTGHEFSSSGHRTIDSVVQLIFSLSYFWMKLLSMPLFSKMVPLLRTKMYKSKQSEQKQATTRL